jgi:hypothetical protein
MGTLMCEQGVSPVSCTTGPSCMNWGFESGTTEGWGIDPSDIGAGVTNLTVSSSHAHSGTHSLAVTIGIAAYSSSGARDFSVVVPLCPSGGTANLNGYTFSAWMNLTVTAGVVPMNAANLVQDSLEDGATALSQATAGQWLHEQGSIISGSGAAQLTIHGEFPIADPNSEGFTGTLYLDDIQVSPT